MLDGAAQLALSRVLREIETGGGELRAIGLGARVKRPASLGQVDFPRMNGAAMGDASSPTAAATSGHMGCVPNYKAPVTVGDCDNWNGCGDTVGVESLAVAAGAAVEVLVRAGREFTPRIFLYTGDAASFRITGVNVAQGPNAHFGPGYAADVYAVGSFTPKAVNWPTFNQGTPLQINILSIAVAEADFTGVLLGIARHTR